MVWMRAELKAQAKEALQRNYWKIVLVAALMLLLGGGVGTTGIGRNSREVVSEDAEGMEETEYDGKESGSGEETSGKKHYFIKIDTSKNEMKLGAWTIVAGVIGGIILLAIFLTGFAIILAVDILLFNPFSVGACRFMLKSVDDKAEVKEITYGFDHSYKNIVRTLFHRDLQIMLWALLFIIPGIYKKYQYRMVSYIMAEHPDMEYKSALQMSSDMMYGHKWKALLLDLSFILWHFLGTITCGIAEVFYVQPYQQLTGAALYRRLSRGNGGSVNVI